VRTKQSEHDNHSDTSVNQSRELPLNTNKNEPRSEQVEELPPILNVNHKFETSECERCHVEDGHPKHDYTSKKIRMENTRETHGSKL